LLLLVMVSFSRSMLRLSPALLCVRTIKSKLRVPVTATDWLPAPTLIFTSFRAVTPLTLTVSGPVAVMLTRLPTIPVNVKVSEPAPAVIETLPETVKLFIVTLSLPLWSETATAETDGNVALDDPLTVVPVPETWRRPGETWLV